jgi:hypothetical protein
VSLQGSLDTIGLEEVFHLFALGRKSGVLRLRRAPDPVTGRETEFGAVVFDMGDVAYATTAPDEDPFAVMAHFGVPGDDADAVDAFLRERVEEAVCRLLQWEAGEFFVDREDAVTAALTARPLRFATPELLAAAADRWERWKEILAVVPATDLALRPVALPVTSDDPIVLGREEWSVLAAAASVPDIDAVAVSLGMSTFSVCAVVRSLVERGLVQLVPRSPAVSPVGSPVTSPVTSPVPAQPVLPAPPHVAAPVAAPSPPPAAPTPDVATPDAAVMPAADVVAARETPPATPQATPQATPELSAEPEFEAPVTFEVPTRTAAEQPDAAGPSAQSPPTGTGDDVADGFDKSTLLRLIAGVHEE